MFELVAIGAVGAASATSLVVAARVAAHRAASRARARLEDGVARGVGVGALVEASADGCVARGGSWQVRARATVTHITPLLVLEARWTGLDLVASGSLVVRAARAHDSGQERADFHLGHGAPRGVLTRPGDILEWMVGPGWMDECAPERLTLELGARPRATLELLASAEADDIVQAARAMRALAARMSLAARAPGAWWAALATRTSDHDLEGLALAAAGPAGRWIDASARGWALGRLWHGRYEDVRLGDPLARGPERALGALSTACEVSYERGLGRARALFSDLIARHCVRLDGAHAALGLEWAAWSEWMLGHALRASQARTPTTASTFLAASARARATVTADANLALGILCAPMDDEIARALGRDPLLVDLIERGAGVLHDSSHPLAPYAERGICALTAHMEPTGLRVAGLALERFGGAGSLDALARASARTASAADRAALERARRHVSARARSRSRSGGVRGGVSLSRERETLGALTPLARRGELELSSGDERPERGQRTRGVD